MSEKGFILDIDSFSTHDGPGIRTAVFLKGCPLSCRWCHSPESQKRTASLLYQQARCTACLRCVNTCPQGAVSPALIGEQQGVSIDREKCVSCFKCVSTCYFKALRISGKEADSDELAKKLSGDKLFFENSGGGVTVSGGEPLMQPEFTKALLKACKAQNIHTLLETCGYGSTEALLEIAQYCDMIFFDIKLSAPQKHREWTGVSNELILKNLRALVENGHCDKITVRTPCIPGVNDTPDEISAIAKTALSCKVKRIQLLPYNPMAGEKYKWIGEDYSLSDLEARSKDHYESLNRVAENEGIAVIRG